MTISHFSIQDASTGCPSREVAVVWCRYFQAAANNPGFTPSTTTGNSIDGPIQCRERLGGMLNFYYREAA